MDELLVNYYLVNLESLFSRNPFGQNVSGHFSHIRPNATETHSVTSDDSPGSGTVNFAIPEDLVKQNVIVEVTAAGKSSAKTYKAATLEVQVSENSWPTPGHRHLIRQAIASGLCQSLWPQSEWRNSLL